jgi:hypothetical protein
MGKLQASRRAVEAALAPLSDAEKLQLLEELRFEVGAAMKISESKLTNGTQGERVACAHLNLEWNGKTVNGCDAWDENGKPVELKCFKSTATRANVSYVFPKRNRVETDAEYARRVYKHYRDSCAGGHYWVLLANGSTKYKCHWYVDGKRFALAVRAFLLANPKKDRINLGSNYCKDCKVPHRLDTIAGILKDPKRTAVFPTRVAERCHRKPA